MEKCIFFLGDTTWLQEHHIAETLLKYNFSTYTWSKESGTIFDLAQKSPFGVIINGMPPSMDAFEKCKDLRLANYSGVIIIIVSPESIADKLISLNVGADDYFSMNNDSPDIRLLIEKIKKRSIHKEGRQYKNEVIEHGGLKINTNKRIATLDGDPLPLSGAEYETLEVLMRGYGKVISRELFRETLGIRATDDRLVDARVSRLRKIIGQDKIKAIRNKGYTLAI